MPPERQTPFGSSGDHVLRRGTFESQVWPGAERGVSSLFSWLARVSCFREQGLGCSVASVEIVAVMWGRNNFE